MAEPATPADENTFAIYALFCGVVGVLAAFLFGIGALFGVMAIVLGRAGLRPRPSVRERRTAARRSRGAGKLLSFFVGCPADLLAD